MKEFFDEKLHIIMIPITLTQIASLYFIGITGKAEIFWYIGLFIVMYFFSLLAGYSTITILVWLERVLRYAKKNK